MSLERALQLTLGYEGGESNDPLDRGGLTKWGVTQATYDSYRDAIGQPRRSVHEMTDEEMPELYDRFYWRPGHCDVLPELLGCAHFDAFMNHRPKAAIRLLQEAVDAAQDGVWGSGTADAVEAAIASDGEQAVVGRQLDARDALFDRIVANDPSQQKFIHGWHNRVTKLRRALLS